MTPAEHIFLLEERRRSNPDVGSEEKIIGVVSRITYHQAMVFMLPIA
jgi:hypothetical protein